MNIFAYLSIFLLGVFGTHLDNKQGFLTDLKFDKVHYKTFKDCNLDKVPGLHDFFVNETIKYKDLLVYITDGSEPRVELLFEDEVVDTIRVGRYYSFLFFTIFIGIASRVWFS